MTATTTHTRPLAPERRIGRWGHQCPDCGRIVKWALRLCSLCAWRDGKNEQFVKGQP